MIDKEGHGVLNLEPSCEHFLVILNGIKPLDQELLPEVLDKRIRAFVDIHRWLALQLLIACCL